MAITDATRKKLWARSGNLCAHCRAPLIIRALDGSKDATVGDEAHIVERHFGGRGYGMVALERLDDYENLILLCASHHRFHDHGRAFTVEELRRMKATHEGWVERRLATTPDEGELVFLSPVAGGQELVQHIHRHDALVFNIEPELKEEEAGLVAQLADELHDGLDVYDAMHAGDRVRAGVEVGHTLRELSKMGLSAWKGSRKDLFGSPPQRWLIDTAIVVMRRDSDLAARAAVVAEIVARARQDQADGTERTSTP